MFSGNSRKILGLLFSSFLFSGLGASASHFSTAIYATAALLGLLLQLRLLSNEECQKNIYIQKALTLFSHFVFLTFQLLLVKKCTTTSDRLLQCQSKGNWRIKVVMYNTLQSNVYLVMNAPHIMAEKYV